MPRIFLAVFALLPALMLTACQAPDAFPYDPDTPAAQTSPATSPAPAPQATAKTKAPPPADSSALASLQGEWTLVSLLKDGKTVITGETQAGKLVITGKRFVLLGAKEIGNMSVGSLSIDPTSTENPKTITLVADPKDADGKARFGIYDFPDSSDFIRFALPQPGERKPDGFSPAKGISILVFKRTQSPAK